MKARRGPDVRGGVRERSCQEAARGRERSGHPAEGQHSLAPTQRPRQVRGSPPLPTNFRAPPSHPHTCPELGHAPVAARRFNRFALRAHTQDKRVHHLGKPGRREQLSPRGSGACAVHRARLCVGKEHAQCEGTIGYVGAQGMLGKRPGAAHAHKRSEPATRWRREKREKSPQSYVRKGRVLWRGCGLPRNPAVLLERGA